MLFTIEFMKVGHKVAYMALSVSLTHPPLDKMAAISTRYFQMHFCEWKKLYLDKNFPKVCF